MEIELKFALSPQKGEELTHCLGQFSSQYLGVQELKNSYYDSEDYVLRSFGFGLRIRVIEEQSEMTLKTTGVVFAGLHQRDEYNVALEQSSLDLTLLPEHVWPEGVSVAELNIKMVVLFTTVFTRHTWLVTFNGSEIECVWDLGRIISGELSETICEIELELKKGEVEDVLSFAEVLNHQLKGLRLYEKSKTQRGYQLIERGMGELQKPNRTESIFLEEIAFPEFFISLLSQWQTAENEWMDGKTEAKEQIISLLESLSARLFRTDAEKENRFIQTVQQQTTQLLLLFDTSLFPDNVCYHNDYTALKLTLIRSCLAVD